MLGFFFGIYPAHLLFPLFTSLSFYVIFYMSYLYTKVEDLYDYYEYSRFYFSCSLSLSFLFFTVLMDLSLLFLPRTYRYIFYFFYVSGCPMFNSLNKSPLKCLELVCLCNNIFNKTETSHCLHLSPFPHIPVLGISASHSTWLKIKAEWMSMHFYFKCDVTLLCSVN